MKRALTILAAALVFGQSHAADPAAGALIAEQCAGCHGADGISVEAKIPNLAGQKAAYLAAQLSAFRSGDRKDALMNAIAAQLSDTEIDDVAAHFAGLPGAAPGAEGAPSETLAGALPQFDREFKESFTHYYTNSFENRGQVRYYYANKPAIAGARIGGNLPDGAMILVEVYKAKADAAGNFIKGDDGHFQPGDLIIYTAMEKRAGWGDDVPAILKNGNWRYAIFSKDGENRAGLNEGRCLACHQPKSDIDYTFTYPELKAAADGG